ncbi:hypothetical protein NBRC3293_2063 [Gluconobacter oxydans NBRC 3293]|uniref:Uncharacterized protein n=1 Tax=Gluconobacter oxydans NBRC 3293 TaxID=1315969 RepID=A0A829XAU8_GLUOY|nr:hypothetical protein NBRC3293_2063 [Gluconobacter oxydans NBRC 3293]
MARADEGIFSLIMFFTGRSIFGLGGVGAYLFKSEPFSVGLVRFFEE